MRLVLTFSLASIESGDRHIALAKKISLPFFAL